MLLQWCLYIRPKLLKLTRKYFCEISDTKGRREPIFQVWGGGKKGGNQKFSKILGGDQSLTHYAQTLYSYCWRQPKSCQIFLVPSEKKIFNQPCACIHTIVIKGNMGVRVQKTCWSNLRYSIALVSTLST